MNLNSRNQLWSLWQYRVYPDISRRPPFHLVKENCARFGRLTMGSASQMYLTQATDDRARLYWEIKILTENHPVHDPAYTEWMHAKWRRFFQQGFGFTCTVHAHARLEAGDRQDGRPADQLIILPSLVVDNSVLGEQ